MVKIYLDGEEQTKEIGYKLGKLLTPGSVICLIGDLGAGKTTMTQSLARAIGVDDYITSPTFTILNEYEGNMPLYHFDVYRIGSSEEMYDIGYDEYINSDGVCIIEWANLIEDICSSGTQQRRTPDASTRRVSPSRTTLQPRWFRIRHM